MPEMDWLEWMKAEGVLSAQEPEVQKALQALRAAQKEHQGWAPALREKGYRREVPPPLEVVVGLQTDASAVHLAENRLLAAAVFAEIRRLSSRIDALERRG
jgi:hypothetical protein